MSLTPGTRLGVFELTALIGRGGMGEVYRATDTRLKRQVAIKILPPSFAADHDRLARFQREAEVLASLNHPHIAAIYGLEESEGITALVMELVEGEDLSQRIARGAIPIDEALPIARQIAEALEAAHEQGIIHRDLKPANIKVRSDGTVKVLDFGLAKALEPASALRASAGHALSQSPTITSPAMTQEGMILGTAAYMSPEQARGKPVDKRADVWAFGCVLYEMLTGTRAFGGADVQDTFVAIMRDEPDWTRLPTTLSPTLSIFIRRCLHRDLKQRVGDIHDVRLALEGAFDSAAPQVSVSPPSSTPGGRLGWMVAAAAVLVAATFAVTAVRHLQEASPPASPEIRTELVTPPTDQPTMFALSPDGRQVVFVASAEGASRLWLRSLATTMTQPLAGTEGATSPFWAPDGRAIAFFADGTLKRLNLDGATPQTLATAVNGNGGTWTADGVIVFAPSATTALRRVSASGGETTPLTVLGPHQVAHRGPHALPGGFQFLFYVQGEPGVAGIYLGSLDGSAPARITPADSDGAYLPAGWLLWVRGGALVAQRLDVAKAVLTGEPVTLADSVAVSRLFRGAVSVSAGLVAYRTSRGSTRQLTWVDRVGTVRGTVGAPDVNGLFYPRVSPDGRRVVVSRTVRGNEDLWLLDGARASRLTFDAARDDRPVWSPDGTQIAFRSFRTGAGGLFVRLTNGAGVDKRLVTSDQLTTPGSWSLDGRFFLYQSTDPQSLSDLWVVPLQGERAPSVFLRTPFREAGGVFSPDGRWVAYHSNESGRPEVYVRPFVPPGAVGTAAGQWQVSTTGGVFPSWRPDGKELFYLDPSGAMMAAPISSTGATLEPGAPTMLFPTSIIDGGVDAQQGRQYDVAPDGRFLINTELPGDAAPITLLMNWNPEAKR